MTTPGTPGSVSLPPKFNISSTANNVDRASLPTTFLWTREYAGGKVVASEPVYLDQPAPPSVFERALHTVAMKIRRNSQESGETSKNRQWQDDRRAVYDGSCSFQVQYLGSVDVNESKGIRVCEDAITTLIQRENRAAQKKETRLTGHHMAHMRISSDAITIVDEETQNVITEDTIQSISYCAAHRRREKCFAYITRVSPQERSWTCHAFTGILATIGLATHWGRDSGIKYTGERLSHAVGCAFEACHEKLTAVDESNSELTNSTLQLPTASHSTPAAAAAATADVNVPSVRGRHVGDAADAKGHYQPISLQMEEM